MAADEPHAGPDLPQPPSPTTEAAAGSWTPKRAACYCYRYHRPGSRARVRDEGGDWDSDDIDGVLVWRVGDQEDVEDGDGIDGGGGDGDVGVGADDAYAYGWSGDGDNDVGIGADDAYAYGWFGAIPASGDAVAALPETTVGEGEATEECAVCLEGYEAGERCISGWLAASRLCPLCRFALPALQS